MIETLYAATFEKQPSKWKYLRLHNANGGSDAKRARLDQNDAPATNSCQPPHVFYQWMGVTLCLQHHSSHWYVVCPAWLLPLVCLMATNDGQLTTGGVVCNSTGSLLEQSLVARTPNDSPSCVHRAKLSLDFFYLDAEAFVGAIFSAEHGGAAALRMLLEASNNAAVDELHAAVRRVAQKDLQHSIAGDELTVGFPAIVRALDDTLSLVVDGKAVTNDVVDTAVQCNDAVCVWLGDFKLIGKRPHGGLLLPLF